jgi:hypothetical protein
MDRAAVPDSSYRASKAPAAMRVQEFAALLEAHFCARGAHTMIEFHTPDEMPTTSPRRKGRDWGQSSSGLNLPGDAGERSRSCREDVLPPAAWRKLH